MDKLKTDIDTKCDTDLIIILELELRDILHKHTNKYNVIVNENIVTVYAKSEEIVPILRNDMYVVIISKYCNYNTISLTIFYQWKSKSRQRGNIFTTREIYSKEL